MVLLQIVFFFMDGRKEIVKLIPSPFCESYKNLEAIAKCPLKDIMNYHFMGEELNTLVQRLMDNRYLKEKYEPMPFLALMYGVYGL